MTDLYRIKELEWDREGRGDCIAQSPLGEIRLHQYFDVYGCIAWEYQGKKNLTLREAKAAANEHHRKEAEKMLESVESGWISCEDRQPEKGSTKTKYAVLIEEDEDIGWDHKTWWTAFYGGFDQWYGGCDPISDGQRVTHWQPLPPQAPVEKGED